MSDDAVVQIISRLGVDFNQAIISAERLAASVNMANTSLTNLNATANATRAMTIGQAGIARGQAQIASATETAAQATRRHTRSVQDLNKEYNVLGSMAERRISWFVTGSAVFGSLAALKEIASTIKDVEMGMTTIARITEDVNFNFEEMRDSLQGLGVEYGMGWENVSDIAIRWSQAGYNVADTLELTKSSLLALNTAELDAQYATQGLIAIMSQWNLTSEQLLPTIDKINKTADSYAVTSQDIVDGLNRVGAAAKNAGMTIEETIGAITVLREASGRTGKEVGTALNTIFSYMTRDKTIKLMEALGIRVFEDEARTTFRSIIELMEELATRWQDTSVSSQLMTSVETELLESFNEEMATAVGLQEEWNDMQQRDISQAAAGVRRKNFFISLMSRFSKIQEVVNNQLDAEGYSMRENERTMATLEKQIESLKAAAEQFAVSIGDAGLLEQMKGLVEGTADVIKWFNGLDDGAKTLIITFAEVAIAIKLLTSLMKMMGLAGAGGLAGGLLRGWNMPVKIAQASTAMIALRTATTATTTALRNLGTGAVTAFGGPWVLGITVAAAAVYTLYKNVQTANATMIAHGELAENMIGGYDSLVNKLSQLEEGTDAYNKTAEELRVTKGKIANALPEVIDGWDEETDSIKINREEMEKLITASKDLKKSQEDLTKSLEDSIRLMQEEVAEHTKKAQEWENEKNVLQDLVERRDRLTEALSRQKEGSEEAKKTEEALGETERLIADIAEEAGLKRNATVDEIIAKLNELKIAENQAVINTQTAELNKVKAVKESSLARLAIIQQEIAAYNDPMSWGFTQAAGNFLKDINPLNRYNKDPRHLNLDNLKKERAESVKAAQEAKTQIDSIEKAIKESQRNIAAINADITPGGGPSPGPGAAVKGAGKEIDYLAEAIQRLTDAAKQYELVNMDLESVLDAVNRRLGVSNAEYDYLNGKVEAGTATAQDYARMQELLARKTALLKNEQVQLANANRAYQGQIDSLTPVLAKATAEYDRFKAAGDEKHTKDAASAVSALTKEMESLSNAITDNTKKLWENKSTLEELTRTAYDQYFQSAMDWMSHMATMGKLTNEQQVEYLRTLEQVKLSLSDQRKLQENIFSLLKSEMSDYLEDLDSVRDKALERIESRVKSTIASLQAQIDSLEDEGETDSREEAERKHNEKIVKLQEDRRYHELRTGIEHSRAIAEIDKQIAEENRSWQQQQDDWLRNDKKEALKKQIQDVKDAGDKEKDAINDNYKKAKKVIDQNMNTIINGLMAREGEWRNAGKTLIEAFIEGIETGDFSKASAMISSFERNFGVNSSNNSYIERQPTNPKDTASSWINNQTKYLEGLKQAGDPGQKEWANQGLYLINLSQAGDPGQKEWARQEAEKMGMLIPQAHIGAKIKRTGIAELMHDERVLSPNLTVSFDKLATVLSRPAAQAQIGSLGSSADLEKIADRVIAAIERKKSMQIDKLLNIEHAGFEDRADMQALGVEVRNMLTAVGR